MDKRGYTELRVYQSAYEAAMEIFIITKNYPRDDLYALTSQIRRSSRSVCANLAEACRKRRYPKAFVSKLTDCDVECAETMVHLDFSQDFNCPEKEKYVALLDSYNQVGKMLGSMILHPEKFTLISSSK